MDRESSVRHRRTIRRSFDFEESTKVSYCPLLLSFYRITNRRYCIAETPINYRFVTTRVSPTAHRQCQQGFLSEDGDRIQIDESLSTIPGFPPFDGDVDTAIVPILGDDPFGMNDKTTDKALDELADSLFGEDPAEATCNNLDPWDDENSFCSLSADVIKGNEGTGSFTDLKFALNGLHRERPLEINANPFRGTTLHLPILHIPSQVVLAKAGSLDPNLLFS